MKMVIAITYALRCGKNFRFLLVKYLHIEEKHSIQPDILCSTCSYEKYFYNYTHIIIHMGRGRDMASYPLKRCIDRHNFFY